MLDAWNFTKNELPHLAFFHHFVKIMQIFYFMSLNLHRSFLRSDVFIKKLEFPCIKFRGPALSQLLVYLILRSFQKNTKFKSVWVCVYVRVCVCTYVFVCINVTSKNNVIVATYKTQHRVLLFEMWQNFKSS